MATSLVTTEGDTRYLRWLLLLDKGGTLVLRHVFDIKAPPATLAAHLNSQRARLHGLKSRKVINDDQWDLLYPPSGAPDSATFDITLLTCLLRSICGLNQTSPVWAANSSILTTDVSVEADICRLRKIRNKAFHLAPKSLTELEYNTYETEIEQVLMRLGRGIADLQKQINILKSSAIDKDCERSLLRAVQEWQDLGTTLIEDNKKIKDEIRNVKKTVDSINKKVSEDISVLKEDVSDIKGKVEDIPSTINAVKDDIGSIKDNVEELPANLSVVKEDVSDIKGKIEDIPSNINAVKDDIGNIKDNVEELPANMSVLKEDVIDIKRKIEDIPGNVNAGVKEYVSDTIRQEMSLGTTVQKDVRDMKDDVRGIKRKLEDIPGNVNAGVKEYISDTIRQEMTVQEDVRDMKDDVRGIKRKLEDIPGNVNAGVKEYISDTIRQEMTVQEDVRDMKDDVRGIKRKLEDVTTAVNEISHENATDLQETIKDLRRKLVDLYKEETARIPIYLLKPAKTHPVQSLYVKQQLKRIDPRGKSEHDKTSKSDDKPIDSITDILVKDGKVCKDVFVSAEAGLGKSSLCAHLVRLWCDAHSVPGETSSSMTAPGSGQDTNVASSDPNVDKDLQVMKKFKLLFYINLSDVDLPSKKPDSDEISDLIYKQSQLSDTEYSRDYIVKHCLSDKSTLVVIDSLDECQTKRLPYRGKHNQSCIVTTSRPWKLESLRLQLEEKHGHQQVEIVGLAKTSPTFLVKNIVNILNQEMLEKGDMKKKGSQFLAKMKSEGLQDFLYIPMMIIQMLMLWFDGIPFGRSQSEIYSNVIHHQIKVAVKNKTLPEHEGKSKDDFPLFCDAKSGCACKNYGELLWKVAAFAFSMLFQENRAKCLSFDSTVKSFKDLTEEEVDVCLKVGLLSEHKLFAKQMTEEERKSVTFPHKTNQEYFAAVYMSYKWSETVKTHINSVIKDLDRAMELDKVLLFCSQLNPKVARELSGLIVQRADVDARVKEYRESGDFDSPPNIYLIHKIQNIVSAAQQQTIKASSPQTTPKSPSQQPTEATAPISQCGSGSTPQLIMADVILCKPRRRTEKDRSVNVAALDMAAVKSVHADAETADVTIWEMLEKQTRCLQTLVVNKNKNSKINLELIHGVVLRNQATLRTLGLHGGRYSRLDLSPLGNKLADMLTCDLTCLLLYHVDLSHEQCDTLVRHLSTTDNLRQLILSYMSSFSHEQCETLGRHLSTRQNLRQLTLVWIKCQTHGWYRGGGCCDVKLQSKLELLKLDRLPFKHVSFPAEDLKTCQIDLEDNVPAATSALSCLTSASNLREFTCWHLHDVASVRELATVLPRLHGLQRLHLRRIDFSCLGETRLSVAAAKTLESVKLVGSTITAEGLESLVQSVDAPRVEIVLGGVTIRDGDPRDFLQRLRDSPSTEVEGDRGVEYKDGEWEVKWFMFYKNK